MKLCMYIIANQGIGMSSGKLAAQVAHAAVAAYQLAVHLDDQHMIDQWNVTGHTKIVLEARDTEHLLSVERYLKERGFGTVLIIDEGRTEIAPHTPTALGVEIVDRENEQVKFAFSDLRTWKDRQPVPRKGKIKVALDKIVSG